MPLTKDQIREALAAKIDTPEAYQAICRKIGKDLYYVQEEIPQFMSARGFMGQGPWGDVRRGQFEDYWWISREMMRKQHGVYPPDTNILMNCIQAFSLGAYQVHMSRENDGRVAYTPHREDGARDKQVALSFGKLLRKLVPLLRDDEIQRLEASHRAELDPNWLMATTVEEIGRVYTTMRGDSGCMRYQASHFDLADDLHPSAVYAAPGMGVAYLADESGTPIARTVVWVNPANPDDKRYVRVYGDGALGRKLERAGYARRDLTGARLGMHPNGEYDGRQRDYVMPYLDGAGGDQASRSGCYVYHVEGEDTLRVADRTINDRLGAMGHSAAYCKTQSGYIQIETVPRAGLHFHCDITNQDFDILDASVEKVYVLVDGVIKQGNRYTGAVEELMQYGYSTTHTDEDGDEVTITVYCAERQPAFHSPLNYSEWLDNPRNRERNGMCKLAEGFGYDSDTWMSTSDCRKMPDGQWIAAADAYRIIDKDDNTLRWAHRTEADVLKKSKVYVSLVPKQRIKTLCHKDNAGLVTTASGRKAHHDVHELTKLTDGQWEFTSNVMSVMVFGRRIAVSQGGDWQAQATAQWHQEWFASQIRDTFSSPWDATVEYVHELALGLAKRGLQSGLMLFAINGELRKADYYAKPATMEQSRGAIALIDGMTDEQLVERFWPGAALTARQFSRLLAALYQGMDAALAAEKARRDGEAAAAVAAADAALTEPAAAPSNVVSLPRGAMTADDQLMADLVSTGIATYVVSETGVHAIPLAA